MAGPVASLAAGGIFYGLGAAVHAARGPAVVVAAASWLAVMNVVLAVFNLLPGAPLDGGRVLRAIDVTLAGPGSGRTAVRRQ